MRTTTLLRYGLVLTVSALLALSALPASPASGATGVRYPRAPHHVTAIAGDNSAVVRFAAPASDGGSRITGYYVKEYGRNSAIRRCDSTRCKVLGLSNGVRYRFVVAAINRFGRSTYSNPSNVVTPTSPVGKTSTITFDANGGSGVMASETEPYDTSAALTLNTFTYAGYSFNYWNSEANGSGSSFTNGQLIQFTASATLYAQWTVSPITVPFSGQVSSNWSGYVLPTSTIVTSASAQWIVPTLNCADTPNSVSFTWVGIGGYGWSTGGNSGTLLQTGTNDKCVNGTQQDFGWFEEYPSVPNYSQGFNNYPVSPGNLMVAYVFQRSDGSWETLLNNLSTGLSAIMVTGEGWGVQETGASSFTIQGSTTGLSYSGGYTAEWIVEDPGDVRSGGQSPFANYGSVTFSNLRTDLASWSLPNSDGQEIVQNGMTLSVPGVVINDGFTVNYTGP